MDNQLQHKPDGSIALFIDGDLQFDSNDECIYHEGLVMPALLMANASPLTFLKVLIIGGGDGLVARELFKSANVGSVELVDYSPEVVSMAQNDFAKINNASFADSRLKVHIKDAWLFVDEALDESKTYDLIISDLTVPEDATGAKFHSVEWYCKLNQLLSQNGVMAVNAVSPQKTPQAFWSIFNGVISAGLHARPYHVEIPSFAAQGFGQDWGFILAAKNTINSDDLPIDPSKFTSAQYIRSYEKLRKLFLFSPEFFEFQSKSLPAASSSVILLHYFKHGVELTPGLEPTWDALSTLATIKLSIPEADTGKNILPPELSEALSRSLSLLDQSEGQFHSNPPEIKFILHEAFELMSSSQKEQVGELINDFLEAPASFLRAIDLEDLISRLLRRASELPAQMVAELLLLKENLARWSGDEELLLGFGKRVIMVLSVALVIGNLLYPDMAYAKGAGHTAAAHNGAGGARGRGRGYGYGNNGWGGTTYYNYNNRYQKVPRGPIGPGPNAATEKQMLQNSLPQPHDVSNADSIYFDESGIAYPRRRYRQAQAEGSVIKSVHEINAAYRLGSQADILADGGVAIPLTDRSYFLVKPHSTSVIDQGSGECVMRLHSDAAVLAVTKSEVNRQHALLKENFAAGIKTPQLAEAIAYLQTAKTLFDGSESNESPNATVDSTADPLQEAGATVLLPSVWLAADGQFIAVKRDDTKVVYLDEQGWYSDLEKTPLAENFPKTFHNVLVSYMSKWVKDVSANENMLNADKKDLTDYERMLTNELMHYEKLEQQEVHFGTRKVTTEEAIRVTRVKLQKVQRQIIASNDHIEQQTVNLNIVKSVLQKLTSEKRA